jgi:hypothetical protein
MDINEFKDNLKLYCVYHNEDLKYNFDISSKGGRCMYYEPIVEKPWFIPYYTKEGHPNSFDNIQDIVNEFTAMVYVYKNNLYSKYIGFCHYDRQHLKKYIEDESIDLTKKVWCNEGGGAFNYEYCAFDNFVNLICNGFLLKDFIDYIKKYYTEDSRIYKTFIDNRDNYHYCIWTECYICEWKYFYEIVGCVYNFICYVTNKYNLGYISSKYKDYIKDNFNFDYDEKPDWINGWTVHRMFAFIIEMILAYYLGKLKIDLENQ